MKTRVVFVPLDERPCNYIYPQKLIQESGLLDMIAPPIDLLGNKKEPANIERLWKWLESETSHASHLILSIDMLMYGGIVPSRLHSLTREECDRYISRIQNLRVLNPNVQIHAFNLIMRVPAYNSDEEEPDYYASYGRKIFEYSWTSDKIQLGKNTEQDNEFLLRLEQEIPRGVLHDYTSRRKINTYVNQRMIDLSQQGSIDFLVIPLDDCSEYGFSAAEQRALLKKIDKLLLHDKVHIYPGADDLGCSLTSRVINLARGTKPTVFVRYSSTIGPFVVPKYEDRPLGESVKSQILVAGGVSVDNSIVADIILMVNSPAIGAENMGEAPDAMKKKDQSYYSFRNIREFVSAIQYYVASGKQCALADVAFCNGGDDELMRFVSKQGLLGNLIAYAGWNTSGNTLGTVIPHAMVNYQNPSITQFYLDRLVEDWGYQACVRQDVQAMVESMEPNFCHLNDNASFASSESVKGLQDFVRTYLEGLSPNYQVQDVSFPWNRLFEIDLQTVVSRPV